MERLDRFFFPLANQKQEDLAHFFLILFVDADRAAFSISLRCLPCLFFAFLPHCLQFRVCVRATIRPPSARQCPKKAEFVKKWPRVQPCAPFFMITHMGLCCYSKRSTARLCAAQKKACVLLRIEARMRHKNRDAFTQRMLFCLFRACFLQMF
nr:hypothetical protein [Pandoravirus massiliensis]